MMGIETFGTSLGMSYPKQSSLCISLYSTNFVNQLKTALFRQKHILLFFHQFVKQFLLCVLMMCVVVIIIINIMKTMITILGQLFTTVDNKVTIGHFLFVGKRILYKNIFVWKNSFRILLMIEREEHYIWGQVESAILYKTCLQIGIGNNNGCTLITISSITHAQGSKSRY